MYLCFLLLLLLDSFRSHIPSRQVSRTNPSLMAVIKQADFTFGFLVVESNKRGLVGYLGSIQIDVQKRIPVL